MIEPWICLIHATCWQTVESNVGFPIEHRVNIVGIEKKNLPEIKPSYNVFAPRPGSSVMSVSDS